MPYHSIPPSIVQQPLMSEPCMTVKTRFLLYWIRPRDGRSLRLLSPLLVSLLYCTFSTPIPEGRSLDPTYRPLTYAPSVILEVYVCFTLNSHTSQTRVSVLTGWPAQRREKITCPGIPILADYSQVVQCLQSGLGGAIKASAENRHSSPQSTTLPVNNSSTQP